METATLKWAQGILGGNKIKISFSEGLKVSILQKTKTNMNLIKKNKIQLD